MCYKCYKFVMSSSLKGKRVQLKSGPHHGTVGTIEDIIRLPNSKGEEETIYKMSIQTGRGNEKIYVGDKPHFEIIENSQYDLLLKPYHVKFSDTEL